MAFDLTTLPIRYNGQRIDASWFNTIRSFILASFSGIFPQASYTLDNNSTVAISDYTFDKDDIMSATIEYHAERSDDSNPLGVRTGKLRVQWDGTTWTIAEAEIDGPDMGIEFTISENVSVAQLGYVTSNYAGTNYVGRLDLKALSFVR